jgi:hypothetical protein
MERTFFRIVRGPRVSEEDFKPAKALGKPTLRPARAREWAEGISVFDSFEHAADRARFVAINLGRFVVAIRLPDGSPISDEQTGWDRHHVTPYGTLQPGDGLCLGGVATDRPRRGDPWCTT